MYSLNKFDCATTKITEIRFCYFAHGAIPPYRTPGLPILSFTLTNDFLHHRRHHHLSHQMETILNPLYNPLMSCLITQGFNPYHRHRLMGQSHHSTPSAPRHIDTNVSYDQDCLSIEPPVCN